MTVNGRLSAFLVAALAAGCAPPVTDAGCEVYGVQRAEMPRPVEPGDLGRWVAVTDAAMTAACRAGA